MNEEQKKRLIEIIEMAHKLNWVTPPLKGQSYPIMQISEIRAAVSRHLHIVQTEVSN